MIRPLGEGVDDLPITLGVRGRAKNNLLEQVSVNVPGAGEGRQQSTGPEQTQR